MIIIIESIVLCIVFTIMVYIISRKPIQTLYNYPPKIQERVKSLEEYKDQIPTEKSITIIGSISKAFLLARDWLLLYVRLQD